MSDLMLNQEALRYLANTCKTLDKLCKKNPTYSYIYIDELKIRNEEGELVGFFRDPDATGYYFEEATEKEIELDGAK